MRKSKESTNSINQNVKTRTALETLREQDEAVSKYPYDWRQPPALVEKDPKEVTKVHVKCKISTALQNNVEEITSTVLRAVDQELASCGIRSQRDLPLKRSEAREQLRSHLRYLVILDIVAQRAMMLTGVIHEACEFVYTAISQAYPIAVTQTIVGITDETRTFLSALTLIETQRTDHIDNDHAFLVSPAGRQEAKELRQRIEDAEKNKLSFTGIRLKRPDRKVPKYQPPPQPDWLVKIETKKKQLKEEEEMRERFGIVSNRDNNNNNHNNNSRSNSPYVFHSYDEEQSKKIHLSRCKRCAKFSYRNFDGYSPFVNHQEQEEQNQKLSKNNSLSASQNQHGSASSSFHSGGGMHLEGVASFASSSGFSSANFPASSAASPAASFRMQRSQLMKQYGSLRKEDTAATRAKQEERERREEEERARQQIIEEEEAKEEAKRQKKRDEEDAKKQKKLDEELSKKKIDKDPRDPMVGALFSVLERVAERQRLGAVNLIRAHRSSKKSKGKNDDSSEDEDQ